MSGSLPHTDGAGHLENEAVERHIISETAKALTQSTQLVLVRNQDWHRPKAVLFMLERTNAQYSWQVNDSFPVVTGKQGMAWSPFLKIPDTGTKCEGDMKAPAGLFGLDTAFGYAPQADLSWPYLSINDHLFGVDDPHSQYYNHIVDSQQVEKDWQSAEVMLRPDGLYRWGLVVDYNLHPPVKGAGSCIFIHIWRDADTGTEGCTAMPEDRMLQLLHWLKPEARPRLLQLPTETMRQHFSSIGGLPETVYL